MAAPEAVIDQRCSRELARDGSARGMPIVDVPLSKITDWDSFYATFAAALGVPDCYGRNMNAWIDCLTDEGDGMTAFPIATCDVLTIQLQDCKDSRERCLRDVRSARRQRCVRELASDRNERTADPRRLIRLGEPKIAACRRPLEVSD
jgi:RNAse (barnase) inhibitor barstar